MVVFGFTVSVPMICFAPDQPPEAVQIVVFVEYQLKSAAWPE